MGTTGLLSISSWPTMVRTLTPEGTPSAARLSTPGGSSKRSTLLSTDTAALLSSLYGKKPSGRPPDCGNGRKLLVDLPELAAEKNRFETTRRRLRTAAGIAYVYWLRS